MRKLRGLLKTLRPHQWVKNLFVAAPLIFGKQLTDGPAAIRAALAVAAFCALSSAVYALNDVLDVDKDRAHPTKRNRPIAAGILSPRIALVVAAFLATGALVGGALLAPMFAVVAGVYLLLNLVYSLRAKEIAFLEIGIVATGFLLRVAAGSYAIDVPASRWLLACTVLLAAFLGTGKRAHELGQMLDRRPESKKNGEPDADAKPVEIILVAPVVGATRSVLTRYQLGHLQIGLYVLGALTCVAYGFYTRAEHTVAFFGTEKMFWTIPFCVAGIVRFVQLVKRHDRGDSPTDAMLRDPLFIANLVLWGAAVLAIIYTRS